MSAVIVVHPPPRFTVTASRGNFTRIPLLTAARSPLARIRRRSRFDRLREEYSTPPPGKQSRRRQKCI